MVTVDWTISVGNILTVLVLSLGALSAFYRIQGDLRVLRHDFRNLETTQVGIGESLDVLGKALTQIAVQQTRLDIIERDLADLKRGEGFVLPLPAGGKGPK